MYNKEVEKLNKANSLYEKVQAKLNSLQKEYRDLAAKKELGLTLTSKEEQSYNRLEKSIKKYDTIIKKIKELKYGKDNIKPPVDSVELNNRFNALGYTPTGK